MVIGRRKILLAVLVVILGAAIFVNWQFGSVKIDDSEASKNLGDAEYVNGTVSDDNDEVADYFSGVRLERQQTRDAIKEKYERISADNTVSAAEKAEVMASLAKLMENIKRENDIENLVRAKGVNECVAVINNGTVTVAVDCEELNDVILLQIKEISNKQTNISFENITIIQVK